MSIEQFNVGISIDRDEHGRWVRFDDHMAVVEELTEIIREFEMYRWDGDPRRRATDELCRRARKAIGEPWEGD